MIFPSDDPGRDFDRWEAEQERFREELYGCDYCDETIEDDWYE